MPSHTHTHTTLPRPKEEVARQLTLIDFEMFRRLEPCELLNLNWMKEETKYVMSPNVMKMINRFNLVRGCGVCVCVCVVCERGCVCVCFVLGTFVCVYVCVCSPVAQVSQWLASEIVREPEVKRRALRLEHLIRIGVALRDLKYVL